MGSGLDEVKELLLKFRVGHYPRSDHIHLMSQGCRIEIYQHSQTS